FYQFFAYFNNIPERGMAFKYGNSPPFIPAPTPQQQAKLRDLDQKVAGAEARFSKLDVGKAQREWERSLAKAPELQWSLTEDLVARHGLVTLEGKSLVDAGDTANFGFYDKFTLAAWISPSAPNGAIISRMQDIDEGEGYGLFLKDGKVATTMVKRWLDDGVRLETENAVPLNRWSHVMLTYDGSRLAEGIKIYIDGQPQKLKIDLDVINQTWQVKEPLRIGGGGGAAERLPRTDSDARDFYTRRQPGAGAPLG